MDSDVWRKNTLNRKQSFLGTMWFRESREHIFPIKVEGFLLVAKVSNIKA